MKIIIPMAGQGQRFIDAGYKTPKPLIEVCGKPIVQYVTEMFDIHNDEFVFICNQDHLNSSDMWDVLHDIVDRCYVVAMPPHKLGPVHTVLRAESFIDDDEPVIIAYCDNPVQWDYARFLQYMKEGGIDGGIVSHSGFHPHTLGKTMFAYSKTDAWGWVSEIKEKSCYTEDRFKEHASSGIYYFKRGDFIKVYFREALAKNVNYNGEFYVTLVFNLLIQDGLAVWSYLNDKVLAFGTPEMIRNFEAWQVILEGAQVNDSDDLLKCYSYWKNTRIDR